MRIHIVMDALLACLGVAVIFELCAVLTSYNTIVQLVAMLPHEFLYVAAPPFVF